MNAARTLEIVRALQAEGQYLAAHDRAAAALADGADDDGLRHGAVLALAQSGATGSALRLFRRLGLESGTAPEIAALGARLLKDQALAGQAGAARAAETAYGTLHRRSGESWHGVNAAAMALLAGAADRARARIAALGPLPDPGDYWGAATLAEASLLRGDARGCASWLATAEARAGGDLNVRRTTRRQLRWIAGLLGVPPDIVDILAIPATAHFCGAIPRGPDRADPVAEDVLRARLAPALEGVRFGFGSLAAGADIVVAEALLDQGADLVVVLPCPPDAFAAVSVRPAGEGWVARFRACLAQARVIVLEAALHDDLDFAMTSRRAMGLARLHATRIDGTARQIAVAAAAQVGGPAGTAADIAAWEASGGRTIRLENPWQAGPARARGNTERDMHAVMFGDLPGFGALDDTALAAFYAGPLRAVGELVTGAAYRNAWGDAVQLVFADPLAAAGRALAIQRALSGEAFEAWGLPATLTPRLALDFGPLRPVEDAVQGVKKFAGRVMTRAARIEPVTPPGLVYATEAFACEIALTPRASVACDYAGLVPTAKDFGTLPLYAVRGI
jgi:hypothetical protein